MVIALFILMVVILLTAEYFSLTKKISRNPEPAPEHRVPVATEVIERYFHPGHSWALVQPFAEEILVGVDDFSQRFIGSIESIQLPQAGSTIRQGEAMVTMKKGNKSLSQVAPISGVIAEVNTRVTATPSIVNDSPLEKGWLLKIVPRELSVELHNLLHGVAADRWQDGVRSHLIHWFAPKVGLVMQDGGRMIDSVSDQVSNEEWRMLSEEFFPNCSGISTTHNT